MCETADPNKYDRTTDAREREHAEKAHAAYQKSRMAEADAAQQQGGTLGGYGVKEARRPSLRERVNSSFYRAEQETRNVSRLKELADLLDTNPAVARILELIETTGV